MQSISPILRKTLWQQFMVPLCMIHPALFLRVTRSITKTHLIRVTSTLTIRVTILILTLCLLEMNTGPKTKAKRSRITQKSKGVVTVSEVDIRIASKTTCLEVFSTPTRASQLATAAPIRPIVRLTLKTQPTPAQTDITIRICNTKFAQTTLISVGLRRSISLLLVKI